MASIRMRFLSDFEYVRRIQNGDEHAVECFYGECRKYFMACYRAIFSRENLKEDIFQQSFVRLWSEIETKRIFLSEDERIYRIDRKGNVRVLTCQLKSFLMDIAKNDYRTWLRNDRLLLEDDFESFAHMVEVNSAVRPAEMEDDLRDRVVSDCIFELSERCREILTLFYYQGLSLDEIIKVRGEKHVSKNGLKTSKYKCMEALKAKVKTVYRNYI